MWSRAPAASSVANQSLKQSLLSEAHARASGHHGNTRPIRLYFTGCPNSCSQIQVADIGFMGTMVRDENRDSVEGFEIFLGGPFSSDSDLGKLVMSGVPATKLLSVVQEQMMEH